MVARKTKTTEPTAFKPMKQAVLTPPIFTTPPEEISKLTVAQRLAIIQQRVGIVGKKSKGYKWNYASYQHVWDDTLKPLFREFCLAYMVTSETMDAQTSMFEFRIFDVMKPDDWVSMTIPVAITADAKQVGAQISYYRRYALLCMCELSVGDEDALEQFPMGVAGDEPVEKKSTPKPALSDKFVQQVKTKTGSPQAKVADDAEEWDIDF